MNYVRLINSLILFCYKCTNGIYCLSNIRTINNVILSNNKDKVIFSSNIWLISTKNSNSNNQQAITFCF